MRGLPYFRWWPADAETDEAYVSMTDEQRGFFHHCLNVAWINGGLPADPADRARVLQRNRNQADSRWKGPVEKLFVPADHLGGYRAGYLVNTKQEGERVHAKHKSLKATESVNSRYERTTRAGARSDSDSDSSSFLLFGGAGGKSDLSSQQERWFEERFWPARWRNQGKAKALESWKKRATTEAEAQRIVSAAVAQGPQYRSRATEHRPHMATWLNQLRFEDELEIFEAARPKQNGRPLTAGDNSQAQVVREYLRRGDLSPEELAWAKREAERLGVAS